MATQKQYLDAALDMLAHGDDAHWTQKGLPDLNAISEYMRGDGYEGRKLARKDMPKSFMRVTKDVTAPEPKAPKQGPDQFVCYRGAQAGPQTHHCPVDGKDYIFEGEWKPLELSAPVADFFCGLAPTFERTDADGLAV